MQDIRNLSGDVCFARMPLLPCHDAFSALPAGCSAANGSAIHHALRASAYFFLIAWLSVAILGRRLTLDCGKVLITFWLGCAACRYSLPVENDLLQRRGAAEISCIK